MTVHRDLVDNEVRGLSRCGDDPAAGDEHPAAADGPHPAYALTLTDEQSFVQVERDWLFWIATSVLRQEHVQRAELSFALVDDAAIRQINSRFLGHDFATDVLSFPLHDDDGGHRERLSRRASCQLALCNAPRRWGREQPGRLLYGRSIRIEGEIIISGETAARVAAQFARPPTEEIALYVVHGVLHLCGFDDQEVADRKQMQQRQDWHLKKFGIEAHY